MLKKLLPVCGIAMLALAGCTGPIEAERDGIQVYPQVMLTGYWLQQNIVVQPPMTSRVGNGQLKVIIPIRTHTDFDLSLDYQYTFVDKNGIGVEPMSSWQFVRVPRKGIAQMEFTSMSPADDFRVLIRYRK